MSCLGDVCPGLVILTLGHAQSCPESLFEWGQAHPRSLQFYGSEWALPASSQLMLWVWGPHLDKSLVLHPSCPVRSR